jgi:hypothetical protein
VAPNFFVFYAVRVISKESRQLVVPRNDHETEKQRPGPTGAVEPVKKILLHVRL